MKKGIHTLIKLRKRELDELRRAMVTLENQKEQLRQVSIKIGEELKREMDLAAKDAQMQGYFGGFAKRSQARQEQIAKEIAVIDKKIAKLRDDIANAFSELKKFEIARDNAEKRVVAEQGRKETILFDEMAGQRFNRKQTEES